MAFNLTQIDLTNPNDILRARHNDYRRGLICGALQSHGHFQLASEWETAIYAFDVASNEADRATSLVDYGGGIELPEVPAEQMEAFNARKISLERIELRIAAIAGR